ncbi:hypothetical protein T265_05550 [Opisthorchis viverrini]|uniref:Uncharacterized protein n=1 Tax=Opisthorchis viverrini TaxID=6198 RepID=A0A074ZNK8_OPIVI|nr:hypothetical protein T265_05550 [Opisthorchis viverrini]KER27372.1 hypothetical protein T265_05550 [Opisthorchis viverrini]
MMIEAEKDLGIWVSSNLTFPRNTRRENTPAKLSTQDARKTSPSLSVPSEAPREVLLASNSWTTKRISRCSISFPWSTCPPSGCRRCQAVVVGLAPSSE